METFYTKLNEFCHTVSSDTWHWFATLSREEWMVVLAIGAAGGFLCLRGFGSRANY